MGTGLLEYSRIRFLLKRQLPEEAFEPQPHRGLWFIPILGFQVAAVYVLMTQNLPWYVCAFISVLMGNAITMGGFLSHEALHGAITRNRFLKTLYGYLGFAPLFTSPHLWEIWHNQVHHAKTNMGHLDPDNNHTLSRYQRSKSARILNKLMAGSQHILGLLHIFYWFPVQGQIVFWVYSKETPGFERLNRRRVMIDTALFALFWIGFAILTAPVMLYTVVLPVIVGNIIGESYIVTNHFLCPQTKINNPLRNSMSVFVPEFVDKIHFYFSHHVEHHFFPTMSAKFLPLVRLKLMLSAPNEYKCMPLLEALWKVLRTPRLYESETVLFDPRSGRRVHLDKLQTAFTEERIEVRKQRTHRAMKNYLKAA